MCHPGAPETSRRRFLAQSLVALGGALVLPRSVLADVPKERRIRLFHTHTSERVDVVFKRGDDYVPSALGELDHFLRDHRRNEIHPYDPRVFDILADLLDSVRRPASEIQVVCGYRTPATNEMLRHRTDGVAKGSLHMAARAIDFRLPGTETEKLREAALELGRGGVGYYRASDFIHVDTGRVRRW